MNLAALTYACCLSLAMTAAAAAAAAGPAHTALLVAACCSVLAFAVTACVELHRSRSVRRPASAAAAVAGVAVSALALGISLGRPAGPPAAATAATRTAAPAAAPAAADIYRCALSPTSLGDELEALVLACPGAQVHLPGPYGDQINYPAGLLSVPGWQVDHMVYAGGEARVWAQDAHQSCLLRVDVAGVHRHPGTRITCNLRTPPPQPAGTTSPMLPRSV